MMRITNGMMMNNCLNNINKNKLQMDKIYTQIESQKLFQKPSEDPIAAIRSLRLRSTYTEIEQLSWKKCRGRRSMDENYRSSNGKP